MAQVISIADWREHKIQQATQYPALACPVCDTECAPASVNSDESVTYRCVGHGHRAVAWRIDADGNMLRGAKSNRYY